MFWKMKRMLAELRRANMQLNGLAIDLHFVRVHQLAAAEERRQMSKQLQDLKDELEATRSLDAAIATVVYSYAQRMQHAAETAARKAAGITDPADSTETVLDIVREMKANATALAKACTSPGEGQTPTNADQEPAPKLAGEYTTRGPGADTLPASSGTDPISTEAPVSNDLPNQEGPAETQTSAAMQSATLIPPAVPQVEADAPQQVEANAETAQAQ